MTKTEKRRLARSVRKSLSVYLILQESRIQADYPDHAERARRCLLAAQNDLARLSAGDEEP